MPVSSIAGDALCQLRCGIATLYRVTDMLLCSGCRKSRRQNKADRQCRPVDALHRRNHTSSVLRDGVRYAPQFYPRRAMSCTSSDMPLCRRPLAWSLAYGWRRWVANSAYLSQRKVMQPDQRRTDRLGHPLAPHNSSGRAASRPRCDRTRTSISCTLPSRFGGAKPMRSWLWNSSATLANASPRSWPKRTRSRHRSPRQRRQAGVRQISHQRRLQVARP